MSQINIFILDKSNNTEKEINIIKPSNYNELLVLLRQNYSNIPELFEIFIIDENNNEIKINNETSYNKINDILFLREIDKNILEQSIFDINYHKLSESSQEILDEKYNCILCSIIIKNEKPYFCYKCQKIFHEKCLKDWDNKCKLQNKNLLCPNCRNELPIEKWNKKLDYEDNRRDDANMMSKINEYKLNNKMNENINIIKDRKLNEQNELISKYEKYINKTLEIFNNILNKIDIIHSLFNLKINSQLNELLSMGQLTFDNLDINNISNVINDVLEQFIEHIINKNQIDSINVRGKVILSNTIQNNINSINNKNNINSVIKKNIENEKINTKINNQNNNNINLEEKNILKNRKISEKIDYKYRVNLKYFTKNIGVYNIFGEAFVINNIDNIDLIINGEPNLLVNRYKLKKGENLVTMKIKNNLTNLSYMFYLCLYLKEIDDLYLLDVKDVNDFSHMFQGCSSLSNINSLQNWNVSNGTNFSSMFEGCSLLTDIIPLTNWNVSKSNNLSHMFHGCSSLIDIKALINWNVSNCNNFSHMFNKCSKLSDITPLEKWNVSKGNNFSFMFYDCHLSNIQPLENWKVLNDKNFSLMFRGCSFTLDLSPLQKWNLPKEKMVDIK